MAIHVILIIRALYTGLFTGIVIAIPMGPAGFESVRWTLLYGLKQGILVVIGALIADSVDVMLINFGLLDLIETNKLLEVFFWLLSGVIIFFVGSRAVKSLKESTETQEQILEKKEIKSKPLLTGFIINFSNPMTHFFWLTLSSTVIRVWRSAGRLPYFVYAVSLLVGMFISLFAINYLSTKGKKFKVPKLSGKFTSILSYGISALGIGFFSYGIYVLYVYITKRV
ncbi:MAG: LysE family transporter [Bacillota bacterium]|nr:LysE family transporter [Bacillota bacterium]